MTKGHSRGNSTAGINPSIYSEPNQAYKENWKRARQGREKEREEELRERESKRERETER
jgi:hypothetical protein